MRADEHLKDKHLADFYSHVEKEPQTWTESRIHHDDDIIHGTWNCWECMAGFMMQMHRTVGGTRRCLLLVLVAVGFPRFCCLPLSKFCSANLAFKVSRRGFETESQLSWFVQVEEFSPPPCPDCPTEQTSQRGLDKIITY